MVSSFDPKKVQPNVHTYICMHACMRVYFQEVA